MSIDRLRYFAAVVETKNLRKAAELVGISPPSMSKAISVLEDELGFKLIHPEGRGIGITPKGLQVYRNSTSLLEEHRRFYQSLKESVDVSNQIRMATFEVFSSYFVSSFIAAEKQYEFLLLEMTPGKIEEAILTGSVDYGLTYVPSPDPALDYVEVGSFEMRIFGGKDWLNKPFSDWPFAIPTTELKIHSSEIDSMDLWPKDAPRRLVKHRFELLETALQTSSLGLSVLHCPDFIVRLHNSRVKTSLQLEELPCPTGYRKTKPTRVYLVGKKGAVSKELERKFARFMRSIR
ncbi:MAG TPA: LysR family transcriptional regulator [Bdellovibrio sp.]|uniref:LysR family transcriptional regulator n=1 Tax=Bdellovibrio sp. TaxID=28201 RepID=UPI002EEC07BE